MFEKTKERRRASLSAATPSDGEGKEPAGSKGRKLHGNHTNKNKKDNETRDKRRHRRTRSSPLTGIQVTAITATTTTEEEEKVVVATTAKPRRQMPPRARSAFDLNAQSDHCPRRGSLKASTSTGVQRRGSLKATSAGAQRRGSFTPSSVAKRRTSLSTASSSHTPRRGSLKTSSPCEQRKPGTSSHPKRRGSSSASPTRQRARLLKQASASSIATDTKPRHRKQPSKSSMEKLILEVPTSTFPNIRPEEQEVALTPEAITETPLVNYFNCSFASDFDDDDSAMPRLPPMPRRTQFRPSLALAESLTDVKESLGYEETDDISRRLGYEDTNEDTPEAEGFKQALGYEDTETANFKQTLGYEDAETANSKQALGYEDTTLDNDDIRRTLGYEDAAPPEDPRWDEYVMQRMIELEKLDRKKQEEADIPSYYSQVIDMSQSNSYNTKNDIHKHNNETDIVPAHYAQAIDLSQSCDANRKDKKDEDDFPSFYDQAFDLSKSNNTMNSKPNNNIGDVPSYYAQAFDLSKSNNSKGGKHSHNNEASIPSYYEQALELSKNNHSNNTNSAKSAEPPQMTPTVPDDKRPCRRGSGCAAFDRIFGIPGQDPPKQQRRASMGCAKQQRRASMSMGCATTNNTAVLTSSHKAARRGSGCGAVDRIFGVPGQDIPKERRRASVSYVQMRVS